MAVYTSLTDDEIDRLVAEYPVAPFLSAQGIAQGVENTNYLIVTGMEDMPETKYILTVYEKRVDERDLPFFVGMMEHLAAKGIPCPLPLHGKDGQIIRQVHGKPAAMVTFLQGSSTRTIRVEHLAQLGSMLARMHQAAEGFTLTRPNALSLFGWVSLFEKIASEMDRIQEGLRQRIQQEMGYLMGRWPKDLPSGVIHADLFPDNVFFEGDTLSGIIDFYFACNDFFIYDLAICLNAWCFEQQREFNVTKARAFLNAYDCVRRISTQEREFLPVLARGAAMRFLLTRAHDWLFPVEGALVTPKDPLEYWRKLRFHQSVSSYHEYGL